MEVETSVADGVLTIRMARPERRNALGITLSKDLAVAFASATDSDVGAIALLAQGDHFCVGGDVKGMAAADDTSAYVHELAELLHDVVRTMLVSVPIVAGVRGWAAGAGMSLVLLCDLAIAAESASFQPAYPGIGVTPDGGMTWTLPRAIGAKRAAAVLLTNRALTAAQAHELGIVDRVVPDTSVDDEAIAAARALAAGPRGAYAGIKRLLAASPDVPIEQQLDAEAASIAERAGSPEGQEGLRAFAERRRPEFGRS